MRLLAPSLALALACLTATLPVASAEVDECVYPALTAFACVETRYRDAGPPCEEGNPNAYASRSLDAELSWGIVGASAWVSQWCQTYWDGDINRQLVAHFCVRLRDGCGVHLDAHWYQRTPYQLISLYSCQLGVSLEVAGYYAGPGVPCLGHVPQPTLPRGP